MPADVNSRALISSKMRKIGMTLLASILMALLGNDL